MEMACNNPLCSYNKYMQHHIMELFSDSERLFELVLRLAEKNKDMSLSKLQGAYGQDKNVTFDFYTKLLGSKSKFISMLVAHILCGIGPKDLENFHESRQLPVINAKCGDEVAATNYDQKAGKA
jgi:hypothetical protein